MARWIGTLNEGSLLRRTALHVGTFVLGSLAFVALMSALLVTIAKAILPPHKTAEASSADTAEDEGAAEANAADKGSAAKPARPKRPRATPPAERESPQAD